MIINIKNSTYFFQSVTADYAHNRIDSRLKKVEYNIFFGLYYLTVQETKRG